MGYCKYIYKKYFNQIAEQLFGYQQIARWFYPLDYIWTDKERELCIREKALQVWD